MRISRNLRPNASLTSLSTYQMDLGKFIFDGRVNGLNLIQFRRLPGHLKAFKASMTRHSASSGAVLMLAIRILSRPLALRKGKRETINPRTPSYAYH